MDTFSGLRRILVVGSDFNETLKMKLQLFPIGSDEVGAGMPNVLTNFRAILPTRSDECVTNDPIKPREGGKRSRSNLSNLEPMFYI